MRQILCLEASSLKTIIYLKVEHSTLMAWLAFIGIIVVIAVAIISDELASQTAKI